MRIAGHRGEAAAAAARALVADAPRRSARPPAGRADQGDDIVLAQHPVDPFRPGQPQRGLARGAIGRRRGPPSPAACSNNSWPNSASSTSACARLKAIRSARVRVRHGGAAGWRDRRSGRASARRAGRSSSLRPISLPVREFGDLDQHRALRAQGRQRFASKAGSVPKPEAKRITPSLTPRSASGLSAAA